MSCFYCGKRVSMVRKRVDADFCCDEHRQRYADRARRTIETLREADEQITATRRLNEGMPMPANIPKQGKDPAELMMRNAGTPLRFGWVPTGLPMSRVRLQTFVPAADLCAFHGALRNGATSPPRVEKVRWSIGYSQEGPRPPRPFRITIRLPEGGPRRTQGKHAAYDGTRRPQTAPPVELGAGVRTIARRIAWRPRDKSIGALMRAARPPEPVKPPPSSPPIVVTLRHATMGIQLGGIARPALSARMPEPGVAGRADLPHSAGARPPAPAYVLIERRDLSILPMQVAAARMPRSHEMRWGNRFVPCPDGFRRRQFYSWEALERFCGMGFATIAGHRPDMRIAAAPDAVRHLAVAHLWSARVEDASTAVPEPRRPAPPLRERLLLPQGVSAAVVAELLTARPEDARLRPPDSQHPLPTRQTLDGFAPLAPVRRLAEPGSVARAQWASGTAEALVIPAWARPQTRATKRTACHFPIGARNPVFAGPPFAAGRRSAGPSSEKPVAPPVFAPDRTQTRRETVTAARAALLPELLLTGRTLRQTQILESACRVPVGCIAAESIVHPVHEILRITLRPTAHLEMVRGEVLRVHPPARLTGASTDIPKGSPQVVDRESLQRFRRRGYEQMRSRLRAPHWPAASMPGLTALPVHPPCPHPARQPDHEAAAVMFRAHDLPVANGVRRACCVMPWSLLDSALPGAVDWGRDLHTAVVALPLPLMLPVDALGPIRDWGLAPPPEPETPPEPIHEDFAAGLPNWLCANADWRQDIAGVRTGSLALLRPSIGMSDYEFEFLCKIENRSVGWVFRAANTTNYHAAQITLDDTGAPHLARYSMLGGEREQPVIAPLDVQLARNASCRVKLDVCGSEFRLMVNDKPVFDWSDDRLPEGGIGFFSDGDDRARLYWVKVTPFYAAHAEEDFPPIAALGPEIHREIRMGV